MAEFVGGAFLSAALQVLFDRLASRELINFFRVRKHDDRLLKKLKLKLLALNKVLNDAENKEITDQAVKDWLDELKDAVYHAEDLVDEIATEALRCKVEAEYQSGTNKVKSPISTCNSSFDAEIESKLESMINTLEDFMREKDVLGLREVVGLDRSYKLPTTSLVDETCVYGREKDKEEIMKLLLSDGVSNNEIDVIPIVGMGGVGKTTLAQLLYNDERVDVHFGKKAWVCVSDVFDVVSITRTIVETINGQSYDAKDLNSLQVKLKESLSRNKFLIVLDDVWNENYDHWGILMTPFRFGAHGSKIIVTTRNESVASIMQTVPFHGLKELPEEDCFKLFYRHAFETDNCNAYPNLEKIGKEIVKKCKGLPLAIKTLGGLLRSKQDLENWNAILESDIWDLPKEKCNILPALRLSYHYLPSHLKRCFSYCSIFTKDYEFDMKVLVSTWIAEGFLGKSKKNKTVEEEGYECFHELVSRSFFQRSNASNSFFVMHDLIHDLAQSVIQNFYYRLEDGKPHGTFEKVHHVSYFQGRFDGKPHGTFEKVRHVSYFQGRFDGLDKFMVIKDAKYLRTFLQIGQVYKYRIPHWLSKKVLDEILPSLTRLRLLSLQRYQISELPHSIDKLIHLRFLDLSYSRINHLPDSICTLYNLETLLLVECYLLTTLPAKLVKLISLRHLDLCGTNLNEMPMHISRLKNLQLLTAFVVGKCSGLGINELKELHHLRGTISISGLQNITSRSDALEAKMREKKHLEKLALEWVSTTEDSQNERDVLEKLEPHTNLKHLEIKNYGGTRFPTWLGDQSFCNMASLRLEKCEFCFSLPPLGQLRSLKELTISKMSGIMNVDREFYGESGSLMKPFESLETLRFEEMSEWVQWLQLDAGEFSRLQKLEVIKCPKLIGDLPKKFTSLVRLEIEDCPQLMVSLPKTNAIRELVLGKCIGIQVERQGMSSIEKLEISNSASLKEFESELLPSTNLKKLKVKDYPRLLLFTEGMMICLSKLEELHVSWCKELMLPVSEEMSHWYPSLVSLTLSNCHGFKSLPLGLFPKLQNLTIIGCINFETLLIPDGNELQNLTLLQFLYIVGPNEMVSFPCQGLSAPNLSSLWVRDCKKLKALPQQMHTLLPSLLSLKLWNCPEIQSLPEGGLPSKLSTLVIMDCKKLVEARRYWGLRTVPSLKFFLMGGESEDVMELFPEEGLLPPNLIWLCFGRFPNLKALNDKGLQLHGSLARMGILNCPQLVSLPEEGLPTSLYALEIVDCPLLKTRCRKEEGEHWPKVAHIPAIYMDGEAIFDQVYLGPVDTYPSLDMWPWLIPD